ncbi:hypothetical protein GGD65_007910 [Bradyrhizobium sp. CIR18]|uniref:hypothetical protein n=1 Tax=Bradyrhizobium sp. CIR18 TaxID=2663839 RepID=UPI001605C85D|nr:hypothetical protein [Bradyrhizobium sp. CIR18]MBB4366836.1 hypothetical protein [Bradyrhizobium sp. CIR18]
MAGLVDATIDASAQMFDESTKQTRVRVTNGEVAIDQNLGFHHILLGWPSADDSYDVADGVRKERIKIRADTGENSMKPIRIYCGSC